MDGYLLALLIIIAWIVIIQILNKLKFWERIRFQVYAGIFLMVKTIRGKKFLDRLASRERFWHAYGSFSIALCLVVMVLTTVLFVWEAFLVFRIPSSAVPPPEMMLGLPGINPIIPLWYGILALVVTIFVHEIAHGIITRSIKVKVESMGLLFMIVPIGAFVEPNEEELKKTTSQKRSWVFAAGPTTNMILAFFCIFLLTTAFVPSLNPVSEGAVVTGVVMDSPADRFGIERWDEITMFDGQAIRNASDLLHSNFQYPGMVVFTSLMHNGNSTTIQMPGGLVVMSVVAGLPAYNAGIRPGMIIHSLNDTVITNIDQFRSVTENETHSNSINITVLSYGYDSEKQDYWFIPNTTITNITLTEKWLYYYTYYPELNRPEYRNISYMGVTTSVLGVNVENPEYLMRFYAQPFGDFSSPDNFVRSFFTFIALPFLSLSPVEGPMAELFEPTGLLAGLGTDAFWIMFNSLYWILWINLMVGLFNALPAVPLDGGYVFKDSLKRVIKRLRRAPKGLDEIVSKKPMTDEELDRLVGGITIISSLIILFLILWQLIGPRIPL